MERLIKLIKVLMIFGSLCAVYSQNKSLEEQTTDWEIFPIINYDTDVGFGYGAKAFIYSLIAKEESFDITIYNSTKGERWYQLIFSFPDKQRRHGKNFGSAIDIIFDYDKWKKFEFYSIQDNDFAKSTGNIEKYTKEPINLSAIWSKTYSTTLISEIGLKYSSISCYNLKNESTLKPNMLSTTQHVSLFFNLFYDTRTDLLNPKEGTLFQISNEFAKDIKGEDQSYIKNKISLQSYIPIFEPDIILASRIVFERMSNAMFPNKLALGGNNTIRGLPQDRYISEFYFILNEELRTPIWWRFGGIVGADIGYSMSTPDLIINSVFGIRFYMDNFVVRADFGIGKETTGFYFNFGHLF